MFWLIYAAINLTMADSFQLKPLPLKSNTVSCTIILKKRGDFNGDGSINGLDIDLFNICYSGPSIKYDKTKKCDGIDMDYDGDIDQTDFGMLQTLID